MRTAGTRSQAVVPSARQLVRGVHDQFANWLVLGSLSWVALPSRCPPRGGIERLAGTRVTVKLRSGIRAECRLDEFFPFVEVFALGAYEVPSVRWESLRTIVDVGANVGAATLWFARQSPRARIVAVEPSSEVRSVLARNIRANRLENRVQIVGAALSDRAGSVELEVSGPSVSARVSRGGLAPTEPVPAVSLEQLFEECGLSQVDVLKLDCEGAEFDALLSSDLRVLRRIRFIVGEYHSAGRGQLDDLLSHLQAAGFEAKASGDRAIGAFRAVRA